jgi:toxin ParE1/3/4
MVNNDACWYYAIYYKPLSDAVVIVRVVHGARDVAAIAERGGFA